MHVLDGWEKHIDAEIVDTIPQVLLLPYCRTVVRVFASSSVEAFVESDELGEGGRTSTRWGWTIDTLPETNPASLHLEMDGNGRWSFPFGGKRPIFRG